MCRCQRERTANRERPVGDQPQLVMRDGRANNQQQHADGACGDDASIAVATVAYRESNDAEWQYNDQHLHMQVAFRELRQKRHTDNDER